MKEVAEERDRGIVVSNNLKFLKPSLQCARAAQKSMQVLGIIKRNICMNDKEDFRLLTALCVHTWSTVFKCGHHT